MAASAFGNAIEFMSRVGVFDVVLPFILVFTLMFAFLEKTKIFGTERFTSDSDGKQYTITRKNLNSMASFVIAFFVVASTQLVAIISEVTSKVVLVIILIFSFTLTVGAMAKETKEGFYLEGVWKTIFQVIAFIAIAVIFIDAMGWLDAIFMWIGNIWTDEAGAAILLVIIMLLIILYVTGAFSGIGSKKEEKKSD